MPKGPKIDSEALLKAGLELMRQNGKPLSKMPSKGRSMLFSLPNGETVRARTCNDHILIVVADSPDRNANLNIEGTDWLLYIMPEEERTAGQVIAFLLPTKEVVAEVRKKHWEWRDSNPNTKGANTTWNLWFKPDGPEKASGYSEKWSKYRLQGDVAIEQQAGAESPIGEPISTLVVFHDLLGFGSTLSVSGGRFDSAIGEIAFQRIVSLRKTLEGCTSFFPDGTSFFHFNDAVVGIYDTSISANPSYQDTSSASFSSAFPGQLELLRFLGASAALHDTTRTVEENSKMGPGGRTFVVLGKRWELPKSTNKNIQQVDTMHANLAFAEAYAADQAGSAGGFDHPPYAKLYVNDHIESSLTMMAQMRKIGDHPALDDSTKLNNSILNGLWPELDKLSGGSYGPFPKNIFLDDFKPIDVRIFHKTRKFRATAAHYARKLCDIDMVNGDRSKVQDMLRSALTKSGPEEGES